MKEFVEYIVKELVDNTLEVEVKEEQNENTITYKVRVAEDDLGKIIGKRGNIAHAIRRLLSAMAAKEGHRAILEILD